MRDDLAVNPDEVSKWIREFLAERNEVIDVSETDRDLFASGKIDSLGVVALIVKLEAQFGVHLTELDFQDARFSSIRGIASVVSDARRRI